MPSYPRPPTLGAYSAAELPPVEMYNLLRTYYLNNGLYETLRQGMYQSGLQAMRPLRNPANRVVEFYAARCWPGSLEDAFDLKADNARIVAPINQLWRWSNWAAQKQVAARWHALYGDLFIKVAQTAPAQQAPDEIYEGLTPSTGRVYFQLIEPRYVWEFDADERDYLTYLRVDIPRIHRLPDDTTETIIYTECWDKSGQTFRIWHHQYAPGTPVHSLGRPDFEAPFSAFGIDFIPVVHCKFRDIGELRGVGAYTHCIDKIDEANQLATRLHQMLFRHNKPVWALQANATDSAGRPLPPPKVNNGSSSDTVELGEETMLTLPGHASLAPLVPPVNYQAALSTIEAMMTELEADLPELAYYRLREMNNLSGRAVRLLLGDLISKAEEARGNLVTALIRANQIGLTIGVNAGLFSNIGTYEAGDFDHEITLPDIIPLNELEKLEVLQSKQSIGVPNEKLWEEAGYDADTIAKMKEMQQAQGSVGETMLKNFEARLGSAGKPTTVTLPFTPPQGSPMAALRNEQVQARQGVTGDEETSANA